MEKSLPAIPAKRYFTIGEVSELCGVKPYVLRYWEQEFTQLKPMKRRGNRRYYQHHEVLLIRRIRELLYDQGFTISGARNRLVEGLHVRTERTRSGDPLPDGVGLDGEDGDARSEPEGPPDGNGTFDLHASSAPGAIGETGASAPPHEVLPMALSPAQMRQELMSIRGLLAVDEGIGHL